MKKPKLGGSHNQCAGCGKLFNSLSAFDKHRIGEYGEYGVNRRCMTEEEMRKEGMCVNSGGWWVSKLNTFERKKR